jgi:hypothetical protein
MFPFQAVMIKIVRNDLYQNPGHDEVFVNTFRISKKTDFRLLRKSACQYWGIEEKLYNIVWSDKAKDYMEKLDESSEKDKEVQFEKYYYINDSELPGNVS